MFNNWLEYFSQYLGQFLVRNTKGTSLYESLYFERTSQDPKHVQYENSKDRH